MVPVGGWASFCVIPLATVLFRKACSGSVRKNRRKKERMRSYRRMFQNAGNRLTGVVRMMVDILLMIHYFLRGKKPFVRGYDQVKRRAIRKVVASGKFFPDELPQNFGQLLDERIIEYPWLFSRLPAAESGTLLDAGSVLNFDYILDHTVFHNKKVFILTLAPEIEAYWNRSVSYVYDDLRSTCFRDGYFNWIVSMSTLEHVGMDNTSHYTDDQSKKEMNSDDYRMVVSEFHRLLKPGGTLYLTVPFGVRKMQGWLQVFDKSMIQEVLSIFNPADYSERYFRYGLRGWKVTTADACADAIYHDFSVDGYSRLKPAAAEAVACCELIKR